MVLIWWPLRKKIHQWKTAIPLINITATEQLYSIWFFFLSSTKIRLPSLLFLSTVRYLSDVQTDRRTQPVWRKRSKCSRKGPKMDAKSVSYVESETNGPKMFSWVLTVLSTTFPVNCRAWINLWIAPVAPLPVNTTTSSCPALTHFLMISLQ